MSAAGWCRFCARDCTVEFCDVVCRDRWLEWAGKAVE